MTIVFVLLTVQSLLGAFDNFWHHELEARLPQRISARHELRLHGRAARRAGRRWRGKALDHGANASEAGAPGVASAYHRARF